MKADDRILIWKPEGQEFVGNEYRFFVDMNEYDSMFFVSHCHGVPFHADAFDGIQLKDYETVQNSSLADSGILELREPQKTRTFKKINNDTIEEVIIPSTRGLTAGEIHLRFGYPIIQRIMLR